MSITQQVEATTPRRASGEFRTRALTPAIGAEIIGVDLSRPMIDDVFKDILETWHRHLVILFRDQHLTEDDQVRFGERFGPPAKLAEISLHKDQILAQLVGLNIESTLAFTWRRRVGEQRWRAL